MQMRDYKHLSRTRKLIFLKESRSAAMWDGILVAFMAVLAYTFLILVMA
jgi:hypothetical protein